jgi:hypothetical protein
LGKTNIFKKNKNKSLLNGLKENPFPHNVFLAVDLR